MEGEGGSLSPGLLGGPKPEGISDLKGSGKNSDPSYHDCKVLSNCKFVFLPFASFLFSRK